MGTKRITINSTTLYVIAAVIIIVAFLLLGGGTWMRGITHLHGSRSIGMANWNWAQILISAGIGFLLGLLVSRRR
jgi:hypothetical protein